MIVHVNVRANPAANRALANVHPIHQLPGSVHDYFVPNFCFLLDAFSIAQKPDVGEVRGDGIKLFEDLVHEWHPSLLNECVCHFVRAEETEKFGIQPLFIADLNREAIALGKLSQECLKPCQKFLPRLERHFVEITELEKERPEFVTHQVHRFKEML